jgi:hypothetical protein
MTELALRSDNLADKIEWAKMLAVADLLPREYQGKPGNLLYAVEYADALGIDRINAITSIHVINGKPSASADLIASLVRRAGHKLRVVSDETHAVAQIVRADDPDFTFEARWDVEKAQKAGLWGKGNWRTYPAAMLKARAITEVARMGASDALYGCIYTPEELGATVDEEGAPVGPTAAVVHLPQSSADVDPNVVEAEVVEERITPKQLVALNAAVSDLGLDRAAKLAGIAAIVGHPVESSKDLTKAEATAVIDSLKRALADRNEQDSMDAEALRAEDEAGELNFDDEAGA